MRPRDRGAFGGGYALVLFVLDKQAGRWDAYFGIQSKYGYRLSFGVDSLFAASSRTIAPHGQPRAAVR